MSVLTKTIYIKVVYVTLLLLLFQFADAQQYDFGTLDKKLEDSQNKLGKDVLVLIYKNDSILYSRGIYNTKKKRKGIIVPLSTSSQWMTAALTMALVDEEKIALEDNVVTQIPIFKPYFKRYITIRECLNHTTGLHEWTWWERPFRQTHFTNLESQINIYASTREIESTAGTIFNYNDVGMSIAGRALERATNKKFSQLMATYITNPLGMKQTTFKKGEGAESPFEGGVSTPMDYINFLAMLLHKGSWNGKQILSEAAVAAIDSMQLSNVKLVRYKPPSMKRMSFGLGVWCTTTLMGDSLFLCPSATFLPMLNKNKQYVCVIVSRKKNWNKNMRLAMDLEKIIANTVAQELRN